MRMTCVPSSEVIKQQMTRQMWLCVSFMLISLPLFFVVFVWLVGFCFFFFNAVLKSHLLSRSSGNWRIDEILTSHKSRVKTE